jgi:hypothetical protein
MQRRLFHLDVPQSANRRLSLSRSGFPTLVTALSGNDASPRLAAKRPRDVWWIGDNDLLAAML